MYAALYNRLEDPGRGREPNVGGRLHLGSANSLGEACNGWIIRLKVEISITVDLPFDGTPASYCKSAFILEWELWSEWLASSSMVCWVVRVETRGGYS